jgi:hypothetical protein
VAADTNGTPNDLLPSSVQLKHDEKSEVEMFSTLASATYTSVSLFQHWSVPGLLAEAAGRGHSGRYNALIDVGALVTGLDNKQVAAALLALGLKKAGVVFFSQAGDRKMVLIRPAAHEHKAEHHKEEAASLESGEEEEDEEEEEEEEEASDGFVPPKLPSLLADPEFLRIHGTMEVELERCGLPMSELFVFYDQLHTTGQDVPQASDARALLTLGKDTNYRDLAQGAFRLRSLRKGQSVNIAVVDEVLALISRNPQWIRVNMPASLGKPFSPSS